MARTSVKEVVDVPAERLWALLADFGNVQWMPIPEGSARVEGQGPGMERIIPSGKGQGVRERLESSDDKTRTLAYTISEGLPLPVSDYRAVVRVQDAPAGGAEIEWTCEFQPDGADEATVAPMIQALYGTMIGWIREHLKASG